MNKVARLVESYVRLLVEAAVDAQRAASEGLALLAQGKAMVLYDPTFYRKFLEDEGVWNVSSATGGIKGFISLVPGDAGSSWGAAEVGASAAEKGYGPLMYDLAMSRSSAPLMPDRSNLSRSAATVWQYYDKRRPDVQKLQIDNIDAPETEDPKDDGQVYDCSDYGEGTGTHCAVNKAYTGAHVDAAGLEKNNRNFLKELGDDAGEFVKALVQAGSSFFDEHYGD